MAASLFKEPFVKGVYISNNFVTVTKELNYDWADIMLKLKQQIKEFVASEQPVLKDGFDEFVAKLEEERGAGIEYSEDEAEIVKKIKDLIDQYVKPAVEMDGGNIDFKSYQEGKVTVVLEGACSGCPSSTVTLKAGIEGMLKRMVPEVKEVVAEMG